MGASLIAIGPGSGMAVSTGLGIVIYILTLIILRAIPQDAQPHLQKVSLYTNKLILKFWRR
jgi:hypothetical protein